MYKDVGRKEHIVNIWKDLGKMHKPREFIQAENQVWDIIFYIAEGADLMTELSRLETDVDVSPWLQVERDPDDFHKSKDPIIPSAATSASTDNGTRSLDLASIPRPILESIIAAIRSTFPMSQDDHSGPNPTSDPHAVAVSVDYHASPDTVVLPIAATVTGIVDALNTAFETNNRPQLGTESQDVPMHNADDDSDLTELSSDEEEQNRYPAPTILGGEDATSGSPLG
ncbi:hypothetical protein H0H92_002971 [Tricholoma furcatifolium]|nr:hypothetical protein H0H92_002971 [Tricholoma furcatifolium]